MKESEEYEMVVGQRMEDEQIANLHKEGKIKFIGRYEKKSG